MRKFNRNLQGVLLIFSITCIDIFSFAQPANNLDFTRKNDSSSHSMNIITFHLRDYELPVIHRKLTRDDDVEFNNVNVEINHNKVQAKKIKIRGSTSLGYRRKSYSVKLPDEVSFYKAGDTIRVKDFYAVSLSMDKDYMRNAISYAVLKSFQLSIPFNCFAALYINDSTEGIYMVYYPPPDYAMDYCKSDFVLRRDYHSAIKKTYSHKLSNKEVKILKKKFRKIYSVIIRKYHGRQLYDSLSARLNLKNYFNWINYNHLFKNGDYTDEVYFYLNPADDRFKIIPWDFDDLLMNEPHEGNTARSGKLPDRLFYSLEDRLDEAMAGDRYVYREYLKEFDYFLKKFTDEQLKNKLEAIYAQLVPYYMDQKIIEQSKYDKYRLTNLGKLKADLKIIYKQISERRTALLEVVHSQIKNYADEK